ncbi:MAG: hypothetical protein KBD01_14245 [Acidobacteria bacterium]|nr:hypothetical protein [Acidobacteriota bacterium]
MDEEVLPRVLRQVGAREAGEAEARDVQRRRVLADLALGQVDDEDQPAVHDPRRSRSPCRRSRIFCKSGLARNAPTFFWSGAIASARNRADFQALRSPDERYRTVPLRGLWAHQKGGFYHDGRFATLQDVIEHYDGVFGLQLTPGERADLEQFLKSL